jgi:hypothetical protein
VRFEARARERLLAGDHAPLISYETLGRDAMLSVPTPEHYLPLLYVIAQQRKDEQVSFPVEGWTAARFPCSQSESAECGEFVFRRGLNQQAVVVQSAPSEKIPLRMIGGNESLRDSRSNARFLPKGSVIAMGIWVDAISIPVGTVENTVGRVRPLAIALSQLDHAGFSAEPAGRTHSRH